MAVVAVVLLASACGRIGFDPGASAQNDAMLQPGDATNVVTSDTRDAASSSGNVDQTNDTCAQPATIDLSSGTAMFTIATQGAGDTYALGACCAGLPDVVIRFSNPTTSTVELRCTSSTGAVSAIQQYTPAGACPSGGNTGCTERFCSQPQSVHTLNNVVDGYLVVLCRDPALPIPTMTAINI
jgi:hypothetical protein